MGRALQGAGGAAGMVLARAIVRDLYDRERAASMIAYLAMAMVVAPMLAPVLAAVLTDYAGWQANFVFVGGLGMLGHGAGRPAPLRDPHRAAVAGRRIGPRRRVLRGLLDTFSGGRASGVTRSTPPSRWPSSSPSSPGRLCHGQRAAPAGHRVRLYFILIAIGLFFGSLAAGRFSVRIGVDRMVIGGSVVSLVIVAATVAVMATGIWHPLLMFGPAMVVACSTGMSMPTPAPGRRHQRRPQTGRRRSGLSGFIQMIVCAAVTQAVGMAQDGTPYPMLGFNARLRVLALASMAVPIWRRRMKARMAS